MGQSRKDMNWIMGTWWGPFVAVILIHVGSTMVYSLALILFEGLTSYDELAKYQPDFTTGMFTYGLFALATIALTVVAAGSNAPQRLWLATPAASKFEIIAAGLAAWSITNLGGYLIQWMEWYAGEQSSQADPFSDLHAASTPGQFVLGALVIAFCAGISEELLCRGLLMRSWMRRWHPGVAIGVSGLVFALLHRSPAHVLSVLPAGLWLGYVAWKTRSTLTSMWAHVITLVGMGLVSWQSPNTDDWLPWTGWIVSTVIGGIAAIWLTRRWNKRTALESPSPIPQPSTPPPPTPTMTPPDSDPTLTPRV